MRRYGSCPLDVKVVSVDGHNCEGIAVLGRLQHGLGGHKVAAVYAGVTPDVVMT